MALRAQATIDLGAVRRNAGRLAEVAGDARLCAVVKAEAYGHGMVPVARAALAGGADWLAVATAAEAAELRPAVGPEVRILVMGAISAAELPLALGARADVVVWSHDFLAGLPEGARVHVKLDTGLGRLGTRSLEEARALVDAVLAGGHHVLAGAMTHFASADSDPAFTAEQLERFAPFVAHVRRHAPAAVVHAANSAATLGEPAARFDLVRCGVALYGLDPYGEDPDRHGLQPVLALRSYLAAVKRTAPGESAGYGRTFIAERPTYIGTVPIGYGDGVRRALHPGGEVLIGGRRFPLAGTVSMDNITVDLGPEPPPGATPGAPVTLIGRDGEARILAEELARWAGTINYEIVTGLSARVTREFTG